MKGLIWKDYRLNRSLLILGATTLVGLYVAGFAIEVSHTWPAMPPPKVFADALFSYGHLALGLTPFLTALLGGNAIACERAERSAHFLAYLPPAKWQILASKLIVALVATGFFWGVILLLTYGIAPLISSKPINFLNSMSGSPWGVVSGCILTFGVGWLGSACLESATIPAILALAAPFMFGLGLYAIAAMFAVSRFELMEWSGIAGFGCGACAFAAGTWCYLRRVEP